MAEAIRKTKHINLVGEINFDNLDLVLSTLNSLIDEDSQHIELSLTTTGGYFYSAFAIFDYLKAYPKPIDVLATGVCHSSGLAILQAGVRRLSYPHTVFRFHNLVHSVPDYKGLEDIHQDLAYFRQQEDMFLELIANRTTISKRKLHEFCEKEYSFGAEEALKFGMIDEIKS